MVNPLVAEVTARIAERSAETRSAYLARVEAAGSRGPARLRLGCGNFAHAFAAEAPVDKEAMRFTMKPNIAIVSAYNDMLSAHKPYETYPATLKKAVIKAGGLAQFAGGVPAMCDGVTQGREGMELSLFSRDVIAMATAIALSHDVFDGALLLGVCDKIVPGLLIGALSFGHLPTVFVPAGPMGSGLPNDEKSRVRQLHAEGLVDDSALLDAEEASYHSAGTCTFYGTANSNQLLMDVMGLHLPGAAFVSPGTPLREALTVQAGRTVTDLARTGTPIGRIVDEASIVNAAVALIATGGSTNHTLHLVAIARAAGITLTWDDFSELSLVVPLLTRIYPNGTADVNDFHAAGGTPYLIHTLLQAGLLHDDVETVAGRGLWRYTRRPVLREESLTWQDAAARSSDDRVLRSVHEPFSRDGGLGIIDGNLGKGVVKVSAVKPEHRSVTAPAKVFESQAALQAAFGNGELDQDFIAVVRFQGPAANGMPELHKLMPALGVLQDRGHKVAIVTDGRMSGASGKVPSAIHLTPEAALGGVIARVQDGDLISLDCDTGKLMLHVDDDTLAAREPSQGPGDEWFGTGRELFAGVRRLTGPADQGATFLWGAA